MMERLGVNNFLSDEEDPISSGEDRIDFDGNDFRGIMDSAELDNLVNDGGMGDNFGLDDADLDKLLNQPDDLSLDGLNASDGSIDRLTSMPIVEVDDDQVEGLLRNIAQEEDIPVPNAPTSSHHNMMQREEMMMQDARPDPLLGSLGNVNMSMGSMGNMPQPWQQRQQQQQQQHMQQMQQQQMHQPFGMQAMAQEVDALQRMVNDAMMQPSPARPNNAMSMPPSNMNHQQQQQQQQQGGLDLEQEKMKLLSRLSEINQRQSSKTDSMRSHGINSNSGNPFMQSAMAQMSSMLQQQQQLQQNRPAGVASVGGMSGTGETPLTSFLRKSQKTQPSAAAANAGMSMLSSNVPGAPMAASVFSENPAEFDNSMLLGRRKSNNPLFGAMDRTTASQDMVRKLSARSLLARTDSGAHIRASGLVGQGNHGNATWGDNSSPSLSFKTSGILPKHASDNHLLRAARGGLVNSRSKQGNMSRENLRHTKMSSMGSRHPSEDSLGGLPIKVRHGSKHKMGLSRSSPYLTNNQGNAGGSTMNAGW